MNEILLHLATAALVLAACGDDLSVSHDGAPVAADATSGIDAGPKGDRWFQESGKILALREQTGLYLDEERASEIDGLLARAREVDIHTDGVIFMNIFARSQYMMDQIDLWSSNTTIQAAWERGDLSTGDEALDALLSSLNPTTIEPAPLDLVKLWFAGWVDIDELVARLEEFSYIYAYSVCTCIDGDDIELEDSVDQATFTFYLRWDDCFSGCLNSHWWQVVVPHDAGLPAEVVDEGGDPLPSP